MLCTCILLSYNTKYKSLPGINFQKGAQIEIVKMIEIADEMMENRQDEHETKFEFLTFSDNFLKNKWVRFFSHIELE